MFGRPSVLKKTPLPSLLKSRSDFPHSFLSKRRLSIAKWALPPWGQAKLDRSWGLVWEIISLKACLASLLFFSLFFSSLLLSSLLCSSLFFSSFLFSSLQAGKQASRQAGRQAGKQASKQAGKQARRQAGREANKPRTRRDGTPREEATNKEENPTDPDPRTKEGPDLANAVALLVGRFTNPNSNFSGGGG